MKKIITLILSLCLCAVANAQIQTKFWGLELSQFYSLEKAKDMISERGAYVEVENGNSISALYGDFGGYTWKYIKFRFYQGYFNQALCSVTFITEFPDAASAIEMYNLLISSLNNKYNSSCEKLSDDDKLTLWSDYDNKYRCGISLDKKAEDIWCILLQYCDRNLLELSLEQEDNEL